MSGGDSPTFFHGQPWSSWIEKIGRDKALSDEEPDGEPSSSVTRLSVDDIDLYGFCPERDTFYGVVCEMCNAIVKPQALIQHIESRHPSGTVNLPPPSTPAVKPSVKTPYCKVSKLRKTHPTTHVPSAGKTNHATIKRSSEQPNAQSTVALSSPRSPLESMPVQTAGAGAIVPSSPVKSPGTSGQPRRKRFKTDRSLLRDREYDPDRHCGVWNEETGKPCTRSLTCKAHTVSLRRTVAGRSKTFDKLLAEHRAAKELPNRPPPKVTVTGTVTVSSAASSLNPLAPNTPVSSAEPEAPSSPPVLSLPDTYPLSQTKLEEDFANEELGLESTLVNPAGTSSSITTPISVVLPSLSPIQTNNERSPVATLIPAIASPVLSIAPAPLPASKPVFANVLERETPHEMDSENVTIFSPVSVYKDGKSQIVVQIPRSNHGIQSPIAKSHQTQSSMPCLSIFDPSNRIDKSTSQIVNGKRINSYLCQSSPINRQFKRNKPDLQQDFSAALQMEATAKSTPYPHFSDISWSNCHPEPLAVSRWLRITSNRKQYNFNIH